ncbi:hypothetical protein STCU_03985 [Strigomonas culicis]|uniref:Uncharacterized protein n=1 Tax=Strigomonas culicis TaxID=28005 RepID=S9VU03_9TRYP|nr:hypothetical protein STCU_03985 [Strigomonas culicis]|eukprot:EPY30601.1 hypothetical protein STCU_03985 [Strigomonas culicis]
MGATTDAVPLCLPFSLFFFSPLFTRCIKVSSFILSSLPFPCRVEPDGARCERTNRLVDDAQDVSCGQQGRNAAIGVGIRAAAGVPQVLRAGRCAPARDTAEGGAAHRPPRRGHCRGRRFCVADGAAGAAGDPPHGGAPGRAAARRDRRTGTLRGAARPLADGRELPGDQGGVLRLHRQQRSLLVRVQRSARARWLQHQRGAAHQRQAVHDWVGGEMPYAC